MSSMDRIDIDEFIQTNMLHIKFKQIDERPDSIFSNLGFKHYKVVLKSLLGKKKFKTLFSIGSDYSEPSVSCVVGSLSYDCSCIVGMRDIDEYQKEFGFSKYADAKISWDDSIKAYHKMLKMLGPDQFEDFLNIEY